MSRKITLILLSVITVVGSLFAMLSNNMFFSDIGNIAANLSGVPVTITASAFTGILVAAFFFVLRYYLHPKSLKRLAQTYLIITGALALLGLVFAIISDAVVYKNYRPFSAPYPFPGFCLMFFIIHLVILLGSVACFLLITVFKKLPEDEEKQEIKVLYVLKTIGWFLFVALVFNRLGSLLTMPFYVYLRNLYMTFPFYIYLLVPVYVGALVVLTKMGILETKKQKMITAIVALAVNVVLFAVIAIIFSGNTAAVSAVSPAMPLERLASKPLEILIHFLAYTAVGVILLVTALKQKEQPVQAEEN